VKTAQLPHGHSSLRTRHGFRLLIATFLAVASLPVLAMNPAASKAEPAATPVLATASLATPAASLMANTAIATPDNAPLATLPPAALKPSDAAPAFSTVSRARTAIQNAFSLLGTPYRWGGNSPDGGFDCSGLVGYVFRTIGIDLPRVSRAMAGQGTKVDSRDALAEGDLVFFGRRGHVDHVGIYIGNGQFLHAPRTGRDVTVSSLTTGYWAQKYLEARRLATGN
jgi:cell wall-associated NlpC family hydrolase